MEIHIAIQSTEPLAGAARTESEGPLPFEGWLELLHALATLIGPGAAPREESREARKTGSPSEGEGQECEMQADNGGYPLSYRPTKERGCDERTRDRDTDDGPIRE